VCALRRDRQARGCLAFAVGSSGAALGEGDFENQAIRVFEGYTHKCRGRTKSRKARTVPMVHEGAKLLKGLRGRGHHVC
jgi:hypothetical protein